MEDIGYGCPPAVTNDSGSETLKGILYGKHKVACAGENRPGAVYQR